MEDYANHNHFEICPYNNSHRIQTGTRFQRHLIECRKNYPGVEEEVCPFNFTHRIKKLELKYHISTCPDAGLAINQIVTVKDETRYEPPVLGPSYEPHSESACGTENWDDDVPAQPVLIDRTSRNNNLQILNADRLSGLKPAEKKRIIKQLARGENLEDIRISKQGVKEEPTTVPGTVLKQVPLPTSEPYTNEMFNKSAGRGQFFPDAVSGSRIRADIFPKFSPIMNPFISIPTMSMSSGRGVACFGVRPPPGLAKPEVKMPSYGRGLATLPNLPNLNENGKAPPGFGMLQETSSDKSDESDKIKFDELMADLCSFKLNEDEVKPRLSEKEERAKRMRRIEKKLKQIEHLKSKIKNGETLNDEESAKVKGEKKLRQEYENLNH